MLRKIYSSLKSWLHYSISFELLPLSSASLDSTGRWKWFGNDPQLELVANTEVLFEGFYMLEVDVSDLKQSMNACLYTDQGAGLNEEDMFQLPISQKAKGSKTVKRVCLFNNPVKSLRFDPSEEGGECGDLSIRLVKLTPGKAKQLMEKKLTTHLPNYSQGEKLLALYENYSSLFNKLSLNNYQSWIATNEFNSALSENDIVNKINSLSIKPLISIVCPVYNTKPEWLTSCINSVKNQEYTQWELILVDDASLDKSHYEVLKAEAGSKIKVIYLDKNSHISAASNAGLAEASGNYVLFLDHDDALAPSALLEICEVINNSPDAKIIYSDEDLISEAGERIIPHFKSDWNSELLRAHNYVTHLCCYDISLVKSLGGMRLGYEGAQDYDLILRASASINAKDIHHIPKILYHWRMVEGSTALSSGAKSYATEAGLKALKDYVTSHNIDARVSHSDRENFYTLTYSLPSELPKVSIIIPTRDGMDVLKPCIDTLLSVTDYDNYEIIILDNGSKKPETLCYLKDLSLKPNIKIVRDEGEFNYSRINNLAVSHASGEFICLLNNDIEIIEKDWLAEMVSIGIQQDVGCVGAKLLYPDGTIQHAGVILGLGGYAAHSHRGINGNDAGYFCRAQLRQQLSAVTGACLLIRREIFDQVGGLDEGFQVAYNDVDFCLRVQALGYRNIYTPFATLIHHESRTRGEDTSSKKAKRFDQEKSLLLTRWSESIQNDPFYNLNLTRGREDFSIGE